MSLLRYVPVELLAPAGGVALLAAVGAAVPGVRRGDRAAAALAVVRVLLAGAVLAALSVTLVTGYGGSGVNLVPGAGIRSAWLNVSPGVGALNLLGNVLMFVPIGLLLPPATGWRLAASTAACAGLSLAVEVVQSVLGRAADVDDVLLNTLGGALGAAVGVWLLRRWERGRRPR